MKREKEESHFKMAWQDIFFKKERKEQSKKINISMRKKDKNSKSVGETIQSTFVQILSYVAIAIISIILLLSILSSILSHN